MMDTGLVQMSIIYCSNDNIKPKGIWQGTNKANISTIGVWTGTPSSIVGKSVMWYQDKLKPT